MARNCHCFSVFLQPYSIGGLILLHRSLDHSYIGRQVLQECGLYHFRSLVGVGVRLSQHGQLTSRPRHCMYKRVMVVNTNYSFPRLATSASSIYTSFATWRFFADVNLLLKSTCVSTGKDLHAQGTLNSCTVILACVFSNLLWRIGF